MTHLNADGPAAVGHAGQPPANDASSAFERSRRRWAGGVSGAIIFVVAGVVALPLVWVVLGAFGLPEGFELDAFRRLAQSDRARTALLNTAVLAVGTGVLSAIFGAVLAWLTARTDMPGANVIRSMVIVAFMVPPYVTALAYLIVASPETGYLNRILALLPGIEPDVVNIYSQAGVMFIVSLHCFAYVFFIVDTALLSMDPRLEEAARLHGARPADAIRTITLPLLFPALAAGVLLAAVNSLAEFGPQVFLGTPAGIPYVPTMIFDDLQSFPPSYSNASVLSTILMALAVILLYAQRRIAGRRTAPLVSGKPSERNVTPLGRWRLPAMVFAWGIVVVTIVIPGAVMTLTALSKSFAAPLSWSNLTVDNLVSVLSTGEIRGSIVTSLMLAVGAAVISVAVSVLLAWTQVRRGGRLSDVSDYLVAIPLGLPGIVLGLGMVQAWISLPVPVYGTLFLVLIAYVVRFLPIAVRTVHAALREIDEALEEASRISGRPPLSTVWHITLPLIRPGLLNAAALVFVPAVGELSSTILLYPPSQTTLSVEIYQQQNEGNLETVAALAVLGTIAAGAVIAIVRFIAARWSYATPSRSGPSGSTP